MQDILIFFPLHSPSQHSFREALIHQSLLPFCIQNPCVVHDGIKGGSLLMHSRKKRKKKKEWLAERRYAKAGEVAMRIHNLTAGKRSLILPNRPCDMHTAACKQKQISEYSFSLALETA